MAFALGCENINLEYASKRIFDNVTLGVDEGAKIGIVGKNGDGKSSLLGVLSHTLEPDDGRVFKRNELSVEILKQDDSFSSTSTIVECIFGGMPEYVWASDPRIRDIVNHLVGTLDLNSRVGELSGGERRRVDIARVLVGTHDILMLDEPTNHLDMATIAWLANHLNHRWPHKQGVLLVVTHDRWFLDEVCTSMWEVHNSRVEPFEGGYSAYVLQRVEREEAAQKAEVKRQNLLRRELAWLSRGARARSSKPKFHVEAAEALIDGEPPIRDTIELKRAAVARIGKRAVEFINVSKSYGSKKVIDDVTWIIAPGDRVGILGENGAGKTTLLRLIQGKILPDSGWLNIGKTVKLSVLSQRLEELDEFGEYEVREVLSRYKTHYEIDGKEVTSSQLLERLGFAKAHFQLPVSKLSGGQKRRLQLMLTLLEGCNVLILDEPGNDMDIDMLAQIENVLDTWPGTLIMVSHDRYLLEHITDNQFAVVDGKVIHMPGGVDQYLYMLKTGDVPGGGVLDSGVAHGGGGAGGGEPDGGEFGGESDRGARGSEAGGEPSGTQQKVTADVKPHKLSGAQHQAARKKLDSSERKLKTAQGKLEDAQRKLATIDPTNYVELQEQTDLIAEIKSNIAKLEDDWLEASIALGE